MIAVKQENKYLKNTLFSPLEPRQDAPEGVKLFLLIANNSKVGKFYHNVIALLELSGGKSREILTV